MKKPLAEGEGSRFAGFGQEPSPKSANSDKGDSSAKKNDASKPTTSKSSQTSVSPREAAINKVTIQGPDSPQIGALGAIFAATSPPFPPSQSPACLDSSQPFFNYDLCTCCVPLPSSYAQCKTPCDAEARREDKQGKLAKAAIWCGLDDCGAKELLPPNERGVISKPIASWKSVPIRPGTCCYKNDQVIFQMPERKEAAKESVYYKVDSGTGEPHLVQMAPMDDKPEMDLCSDTFLMTISKLDDSGKPRKLQLAIKSPRDLDVTPCITTTTTQYEEDDVPPGWPDSKDGGKKKKDEEGGKGKGKKDKGKKKK